MPSLRKKVAGFIRHLSVANQTENVPVDQTDTSPPSTSSCFIQRYLNGHDIRQHEPNILHGRLPHELPRKLLGPMITGSGSVVSALTGPDGGLTTVNQRQRHLSISDPDVDYIDILEQKPENERVTETDGPWDQLSSLNKNETIAGVSEWGRLHPDAYGIATTLYERHPLTGINAGHPIADCFAVVVRSNSAILALADGVNWGEKACVAARSAIHGCVAYLTRSLFQDNEPVTNTTEVFVALLRSFHEAHSLILQEQGMLTTLTAAVVIPLQPGRGGTYVACLCNVGDSLAYVYSQTHGVREITKGSHDIHCMRDMRDALGALGPVDGQNPELNNLTCSMTELDEGDIVFLTSDGISDNFDPVVGKFAVLPTNNEQQQSSGNSQTPGTPDPASGLPVVQAYQRHELSLLRMDDLLRHGVSGEEQPCADTKQLCEMLVDFATRLTAAKRHILEDPDLYVVETSEGVKELSKAEQRQRRRQVCEKLSMVPGKLDHATVVAFKVGTREKITDLPKETDH